MKMEEEKEKQDKEEGQVVTPKDFEEKNIKEEELMKVVLKCGNCGHKDLLKNFLKEKEPYTRKYSPLPTKPYIDDKWKPRPYRKWIDKVKYKTVQSSTPKKKIMMALDSRRLEKLFYCPKCGSSLVVLDTDFAKNNIVRMLESEK